MTREKIYYIIGAFGSGKTTLVRDLKERYNLISIIEDDIMLEYLKSPHLLMRSNFYMFNFFYRLQEAIRSCFYYWNSPSIICDGHPMIPFFYLQTLFEIEHGITVNLEDIFYFGKLHHQMVKHSEKIFLENDNIVFHLNIPFEENWRRVMNRYDERKADFAEESDMDYLISIRRVINQHVKIYTEEMYHSEYIKVKSVKEIEEYIKNEEKR